MEKVTITDSFTITGKGVCIICDEFDGWETITELEAIPDKDGIPRVALGNYKVKDRERPRGQFVPATEIAFLVEMIKEETQ